jgi:AraC-like DNA-binding protein
VSQAATGQPFALSRALLPGYVASTVGYEPSGQPRRIHRGLPSPYLTFIVSLAAPVITGETADQVLSTEARRTGVLVGGVADRVSYVLQEPDEQGIQLAVHPLAARALFATPARHLHSVTDGLDVLGPDAERLRDRLAGCDGWPARFAVVQSFLRDRIGQRPPERIRPEIAEAWRWLARHRGSGSMSGLARHVSLSSRQLSAVFGREVGASPKQVGRLMRFDHAKQLMVRAVSERRRLDLADIATTCGYYDHAHLDRDFGQYVGTSPTGWLAEERRNIQAQGHRNGEDWSHDLTS